MNDQDKGITIKHLKGFLLILLLGLSVAFLLSRFIPNTYALLSSKWNQIITFKAADTFPTATKAESNEVNEAIPDKDGTDKIKSDQENTESLEDASVQENKSDAEYSNNKQEESTKEVNSKGKPQQFIYRVRKEWDDQKSQIGAFVNEEKARALAEKNNGYKVFDPNGKEIK